MSFERALRNSLSELVGSDELVSLYVNSGDLEKFIVGSVEYVSEQIVMLKQFNSRGEYEGHVALRPGWILRFSPSSDYLQGLCLLRRERERERPIKMTSFSHLHEVTMFALLKHAQATGVIVTVTEDGREELSGFVRNVSTDHVEIECILDHGQSEGRYFLPLEEIWRLLIDDPSQDDRVFLYTARLGLQSDRSGDK